MYDMVKIDTVVFGSLAVNYYRLNTPDRIKVALVSLIVGLQ